MRSSKVTCRDYAADESPQLHTNQRGTHTTAAEGVLSVLPQAVKEVLGINKLESWQPVIFTVPFSLAYRYVVGGVFAKAVSWGSVVGMNMPALMWVTYNLRQRRFVPFSEVPIKIWAVTLIAITMVATVNYALGPR